jgi:DUF4097 and DUF4098 domain-containing protein YvlB
MRNLKIIRFMGLALFLCLANANGLHGQQGRGVGISGTRTFDVRPGGTLTLDLKQGGSIEVGGWDRNEIEVVYRDRGNDERDFTITFDRVQGGLEIDAQYAPEVTTIHLRMEIRVPRRYNLQTHSAGGGITLSNLEGTFAGTTGGGAIIIRHVKGEARLSSGGGGIEITDSELDGRVSTGGGEVLVQNVIGDVSATSGGGNVQYRNVRNGNGGLRAPSHLCDADITENTILITNAGGGIDLSEAPNGACVRTGGGDIDIRGGERFIHASTGGGDVDIHTESGDVVASTGAGRIEVVVERGVGDGRISLGTGTGDVLLVVPRGFSARYDLTIGYTRNSSQDFRIITDVDLQEDRTTRWDSSWGTPRKFIHGSGETGNGDYRVRIRTTNGNITIKER